MCLLLLSVLILISWLIASKIQDSKESEFVINYNVLLNIIELYKETILNNKIMILKSQFDLNERSKTNSLQAFEKAKNDLISETVKEILKQYLSDTCRKALLKKYSIDGLSLLILTLLKR